MLDILIFSKIVLMSEDTAWIAGHVPPLDEEYG
jgi:hypothetical protein